MHCPLPTRTSLAPPQHSLGNWKLYLVSRKGRVTFDELGGKPLAGPRVEDVRVADLTDRCGAGVQGSGVCVWCAEWVGCMARGMCG